MVGDEENILVELDYDNISLIDPNKVIDEMGNVSDRLVKQENLVYYANLECVVLPRTKLAVGTAMNDSTRTISVGRINFLNPGNKTFLDDAYTDEVTGKNTLTGKGVNQPKQTSVKNPNQSNDYYITQNLLSNGTPGAVDNGLLGIKSITVNIGTDFLPVIDVDLEDVKGRALFEGGNNSPYSAFFQLPYPQFTLTLKGYYGKAIKFPIMLQSFTSTFDPSTHNFQIKLKFYGYKYTLLSYVNFGALMAVPGMYKSNITTTPITKTQGDVISTSTSVTTSQTVSRGYQKMKEIYSNYKSKGLLDDNFPEITLLQLKYKLQTFIDQVLDQFEKENMGLLTDMTLYTNNLLTYQQKIFLFSNGSWFSTYMDRDNPIVFKNKSQNAFVFKQVYEIDPSKKQAAISQLKGDISQYNDVLNQNSVFGIKGSYTVGGIKTQSEIPNNITLEKTFQRSINIPDIDLVATYLAQKNAPKGNFNETDQVIINFKNTLQKTLASNNNIVYVFEGPSSFMDTTDQMAAKASETRKQIESNISKSLATKFNAQGSGGLGFVPSVRNILAVFYCQGEAFLKLMDEVHKNAWDKRENKYRRAAIFGNITSAPSVDIKDSTQNNEPIYPWPQVIKETIGEKGEEKFEIIYPGDQTVATTYRAYSPEIWPEVEFVEQFIKGYTERLNEDNFDTQVFESNQQPFRESLNGLDFPINNEVFQNKEESKYFYEIYERLMVNAFYSRFNRKSGYSLSIYEAEADSEAVNVLQSLGVDNPFLSKKIKEYLLDSNNYLPFLQHISNQGQGESWQQFIRGEFVTPYLRNDVTNPNVLYNGAIFQSLKSQPGVSLANTNNIINLEKYLSDSTTSNEFDFVDTYPLTNYNWVKTNMANGNAINNDNETFDTKLILNYNEVHKTVTNFKTQDTNNYKRPFTHFNFINLDVITDTINLKSFYQTREFKNQLVTEGNLTYEDYSNYLTPTQTTSMLNTPYFINAIQKGVFNFRYKQTDLYPYKSAAYLFLNSLPLATLKEKYRSLTNGKTTDLNYIMSTLKKFGGVHKLPYAWILKYGSIWHRYKTFKKTGIDFLDDVWKDFNYLENWDPSTSATTYSYNLTIDGIARNLVLDTTTSSPQFTDINTGFYPKLIDDFNVFIQGKKLFSEQTQVSGTCVVETSTGTCETLQVTGTCSTTGTGITINSITDNLITLPHSIFLPSLNASIQLVTQVNGVTGGTGYYTTPLNFNAAFTNLDFILGSFATIKSQGSIPIQVGQILSGSLTVTGLIVQTVISSSATTTSVTQQTSPNLLAIPPEGIYGLARKWVLLKNGDTITVFSEVRMGNQEEMELQENGEVNVITGLRSFVVLRNYMMDVIRVGELGSVTSTDISLINEIIRANFGSLSTNPEDPQYIEGISNIEENSAPTSQTTDTYFCEVSTISAETFEFKVINPPIQVIAIDSDVLTNGSILNGQNLNGNLTITSQISGTTGGIGLYSTSTINPGTTSEFIVQNAFIQGIGSQQIQNHLNNETLIMMNTTNSTIFETPGFDQSNSQRSMRISPWSVVVRDTIDTTLYFVLPSFGTDINQSKFETFKNGKMKVELSNNPAMFNGSVRLFWNAPQYGWFDNSKVLKNDPATYLKQIFFNQADQQNFSINGKISDYSNFEELFTTFDTKILDTFESEFLNFSRSVYDFVDTLPNPLVQQESIPGSLGKLNDINESEKSYKNFQLLMRSLFVINKPVGTSPEIKLQSVITDQNEKFKSTLTDFMNYDVAFKYGNPSNYNKRLYYTFSTKYIEDPIIYGAYEQGNLPPQVTLAQSEVQNPKTWEALKYYVGNSTIPKLEYKNSGSYITDFFIDLNVAFNEKNAKEFAPLIHVYASQKLLNPNLNVGSFYKLMDKYIDESIIYIGNAMNVMLPYVRKQLPNVFITEDGSQNRANLEAGFTEQTRTELWETFKALNDTWIAGFDFENKTLFEDVLLVDRASRNVGDKVLVDIYGIINLLEDGATEKNNGSNSYKNTLLDMITTILVQNNFQHFMLPAYVNFYNVQDAIKNPVPRPDGTMEVGNMMFGTYLNVDYRQSSPKFLCYYVNKPSEHLNMKDNIDYRYRDDAFDLRRASDNPLLDNISSKTDWDKSNKIVGFNVDPTRENQQIFKSFSVNQDPGKPTSESLEMLNQMANLGKNRRSTTQNVSLYNLYKNRSYTCSVEMMGCVLIQPLMYFNIRNIPMFSGPYMITNVSHIISETGFDKSFSGTRQPFYSLPTIDNFLQTLNTKLMSQLKQKVTEGEQAKKAKSENVLIQASNTIANLDSQDTLTKNQDCAAQINSRYSGFIGVDEPSITNYSDKELYNTIREVLTDQGYSSTGDTFYDYSLIIFIFIYVDSGNTGIKSYENNFSTINLTEVYGDKFFEYINRKYFCVSRGANPNLPIVSFRTLKDFVKFVFFQVRSIPTFIKQDISSFSQFGENDFIYTLAKEYVLHYPVNQNENVYTQIEKDPNQLNKLFSEFLNAQNVFEATSTN